MAPFGGGAYVSSLYGCLVASNQASQLGGGIDDGMTVRNCTIVGNTSQQGSGGVNGATSINSCIIYANTVYVGSSSNYANVGTLSYCCTTPLPPINGFSVFNLTNDPVFIDFNRGNYRLQGGSPCINSGTGNSSVATDLAGNPRVVDGFVDIGAYEYQTAGFTLPYLWAKQYGLSLDGTIDSDGDGMNNWQEAFAGTIPTNAASIIKMLSVSNSVSGNLVKWQGVAFRVYYLQRCTNFLAQPAFVSIHTNVSSVSTTLSFTDTTANTNNSCYYRVLVQ
jgi:hypothetical protein